MNPDESCTSFLSFRWPGAMAGVTEAERTKTHEVVACRCGVSPPARLVT